RFDPTPLSPQTGAPAKALFGFRGVVLRGGNGPGDRGVRRFINPAYNFLRRDFWFGQMDGYAVSLFRMVMSLLMLKEVVYHIPIAGLFYSDGGVFPRSVLLTDVIRAQHLSLMEAIPTDWLVVLFFLAWGAVALCLLIGYRTRLMSVLNFVI